MRPGIPLTPRSAAAVVALATGLAGLPDAGAVTNVFFSGRAIGALGTVKAGPTSGSITLVDNQMSCSGVPNEETLNDVTHASPIKVSARTVSTYTLGRDNTATATSSIEGLKLGLPDLDISADALSTNAQVKCEFVPSHATPSGLRAVYTVTGGSDLGTINVNGKAMAITGEANQTMEVPGVATLIVNEQARSSRSLVVSALHIKLLDDSYPANGDLVLGYSRAKLTCEP